jgi:xylulokinase
VAPEPDVLRHDAKKAWRAGPRKAFEQVTAELEAEGNSLAGVAVASMVPSMTAVGRQGVPLLPGLLYGDREGRPTEDSPDDAVVPLGAMPDAEGFLRWASREVPDARGYWPCQAVATNAISGLPAIDTGVTASLGMLHTHKGWNTDLLGSMGIAEKQMPLVVPMGEAAGTLPGSDVVITGGTIDAFCDQIVSGAIHKGDVLVIFGATLICWVICDEWLSVDGLISYPSTTPDRYLVGGPSNAGALFVDWARHLLRDTPRPGPKREQLEPRLGTPGRVPVWLPYVRGERTPFEDHTLRSNIYGLDIGSGAEAMERAAYEASGFVVRRMIERAGVKPTRIVASGGGSRVTAWMAAVADATNLPVETVAVPEGAALGAAFFARLAAGLEASLDDSTRWKGVTRSSAIWARARRRLPPGPVGPGSEATTSWPGTGGRDEGGHRVVDVARVEVAQQELGIRAAETREDRLHHHPVGRRPRVVDVMQAEGDLGEHRSGSSSVWGGPRSRRAGRRTAGPSLRRRLVAQRAHTDEEVGDVPRLHLTDGLLVRQAMLELLAVDRIDHAVGNRRGGLPRAVIERCVVIVGPVPYLRVDEEGGIEALAERSHRPRSCPTGRGGSRHRVAELTSLVTPSLLSRGPLAHCSSQRGDDDICHF